MRRRFARLALVSRRIQPERGGEQGQVGERLREVSHLALQSRIVLFGEQSDVIGERDDVFEQSQRVVMAPLERVVSREPKAAREKRALAGG